MAAGSKLVKGTHIVCGRLFRMASLNMSGLMAMVE
jgi:hypothetical protein